MLIADWLDVHYSTVLITPPSHNKIQKSQAHAHCLTVSGYFHLGTKLG